MIKNDDSYQQNDAEYLPSQTTTFAKKLARKLIKDSKIKEPPVLLRNIFPSVGLNIKVISKDLGGDDGFCVQDKIIGYNSLNSEHRNRFTVAHELGHILLGHNTTDGQRFKINFYSKDPNEVNANTFAAELLVPATMLKKEKLGEMAVTDIAKKYNVSDDMMFWRLKEAHLELKVGSLDVKLFDKNQKRWKI